MDSQPTRFRVAGAGVVVLAVIGLALVWALRDSELGHAREAKAKVADAGPQVEVATVAESPATRKLMLLADVRPYQAATLYAKVSGYLKAVRVDKGDTVKAGQLLAEI